jgi:cytochrome b6-f complex iron-sulfur subunit
MELPNHAGSMALHDDELTEDRRDFIKAAAATTMALGIGTAVVECNRFLKPNVVYESSKVFKVGEVSTFPIDSRTVIDGRGVEIVRERDGIHAISLVCTHLGCLIKPVESNSEPGYACPCHGSTFNMEGQVLGGPAPRSLPWYEIYVDLTGNLVVDTTKVNHRRTKLVV